MPKLLFKFRVDFWRSDDGFASEHQWPVFHRWLPNGEKDALSFDMKDPNIALKLWFEQWGEEENSLIEYKRDTRNFDPTIIPTQGYLVAGPLFGLLTIDNFSDEHAHLLRFQIMFIGTFLDKISLADLNHTIKAIEMRNQVVHDGWEPSSIIEVKASLRGLIRLTTLLLSESGFKFPRAKLGNMRKSIEDWRKES